MLNATPILLTVALLAPTVFPQRLAAQDYTGELVRHLFEGTKGTAPLNPDAPDRPADTLQTILQNLQSADSGVHQRALKAFADLPDSCREDLAKAIPALRDEATRQLAQQRLTDIDAIAALTPPLSLHVRNATLTTIVPQLQSQLNARLRANPLSRVSRYTLDVDKLPLWEIFTRLAAQRPVGLANSNGTGEGLVLVDTPATDSPDRQRTLVDGPFMFYARWQAAFPTQNSVPIPREDRHEMVMGFAPDPRLPVLEMHWAAEPLKDEKGHVLFSPQAYNDPPGMEHRGGDALLLQRMKLKTPDDAGEKIPRWRIHVRVVLALSSLELDIPDIEKDLGEAHTLGCTRVTFTSFQANPQIILRGTSTSLDPNTLPYHLVEIYNQKGERLMHRSNAGMINYGEHTTPPPPYRVHLTVPQRVRTIDLRFEIKDWELPKN